MDVSGETPGVAAKPKCYDFNVIIIIISSSSSSIIVIICII